MDCYPEELKLLPDKVVGVINLPSYHDKMVNKLKGVVKGTKFLKFEKPEDLKGFRTNKHEYGGYNPKGILKRCWITKHQNLIPSVLIVFFELDLKKSIKSEESRIIKEFENIRKNVKGNNRPKFVVLLLTKESLPANHQYDEFTKNIKHSCQLENKLIHFCEMKALESPLSLPKFDKIVSDLSILYYKEVLFRVRKLKNEVKKETQPELYVRHRFKVGIYHEILRNPVKSLKYYKQAYEGARFIKRSSNDKEHHFVIDWVNFKIIKHLIKEGKILEGITQFHLHINRSQSKKKFILEHEYYRNMFKQYKFFAQTMVKHKSKLNLKLNHQNPGFYYQMAAFYAKCRRNVSKKYEKYEKLAKELYPKGLSELVVEEETVATSGFVGDDVKWINESEKKFVEGSKNKNIRSIAKEIFFEHEKCIIEMLMKGYALYKGSKYSGYRKNLLYILLQIADEHYTLGNYKDAKQHYKSIKLFYFQNEWYDLLTPILKKFLQCCKELQDSKDYIDTLLYLLCNKFMSSKEEILRYQTNFNTFILAPNKLNLPPLRESLSMMKNEVYIELKMNFDDPFTTVYKDINCNLRFHSHWSVPLDFTTMEVKFNDPTYDIHKTKVTIKPGVNLLSYCLQIGEKKDIEIQTVTLKREGTGSTSLTLEWKNNQSLIQKINNYDKREEVGSEFINRPIVRVMEPESDLKLSFTSSPPMLINEKFALLVTINSNSENVLKGQIFINSPFKDIVVYDKKMDMSRIISFGQIKPNKSKSKLVYVKTTIPELKKINFTVEYATNLYPKMVTNTDYTLYATYPFLAKFNIIGTRNSSDGKTLKITPNRNVDYYQKVQKSKVANERFSKKNYLFFTNEPFVVSTHLRCDTPYKLFIKSVDLLLEKSSPLNLMSQNKIKNESNYPVLNDESAIESSKKALEKNDVLSFSHILVSEYLKNVGMKSVHLGKLKVSCKREKKTVDDEILHDFAFQIPLPQISIVNSPISISLDYTTSNIRKGKPMEMKLCVYNNSESVQEAQLTVRDSKGFLISGTTEVIFKILPFENRIFKFICIPIISGSVELPKFVIASLSHSFFLVQNESWEIHVF